MVGGFAESPYMYEKIQGFAELNGIHAIRPPNAYVCYLRLIDLLLISSIDGQLSSAEQFPKALRAMVAGLSRTASAAGTTALAMHQRSSPDFTKRLIPSIAGTLVKSELVVK